jgi:hypothetical protein
MTNGIPLNRRPAPSRHTISKADNRIKNAHFTFPSCGVTILIDRTLFDSVNIRE